MLKVNKLQYKVEGSQMIINHNLKINKLNNKE